MKQQIENHSRVKTGKKGRPQAAKDFMLNAIDDYGVKEER